MSLSVLAVGKLISAPERRTGNSGKRFALARMAAATEDGDALCSLIAFGPAADQLLGLDKGDSLSVAGRSKVSAWLKDGEPRAGLSITVDAVLTPYHVQRRRQAMRGAEGATDEA